jgi:hypothetical protein
VRKAREPSWRVGPLSPRVYVLYLTTLSQTCPWQPTSRLLHIFLWISPSLSFCLKKNFGDEALGFGYEFIRERPPNKSAHSPPLKILAIRSVLPKVVNIRRWYRVHLAKGFCWMGRCPSLTLRNLYTWLPRFPNLDNNQDFQPPRSDDQQVSIKYSSYISVGLALCFIFTATAWIHVSENSRNYVQCFCGRLRLF